MKIKKFLLTTFNHESAIEREREIESDSQTVITIERFFVFAAHTKFILYFLMMGSFTLWQLSFLLWGRHNVNTTRKGYQLLDLRPWPLSYLNSWKAVWMFNWRFLVKCVGCVEPISDILTVKIFLNNKNAT